MTVRALHPRLMTLALWGFLLAAACGAQANRLDQIISALELNENPTAKQVVEALEQKVRTTLLYPPSSLADFNQRITELTNLGFDRQKLNKVTFTRKGFNWVTPWVWDNLQDLNNVVASHFQDKETASFTEIRQAAGDDPLPSPHAYWESIQELLQECQRFLAADVDRILNESHEDPSYNPTAMRRGQFGEASILDKNLIDHFSSLKDNHQILKLFADIATIMWADLSMFAHLDYTPDTEGYSASGSLLDWRSHFQSSTGGKSLHTKPPRPMPTAAQRRTSPKVKITPVIKNSTPSSISGNHQPETKLLSSKTSSSSSAKHALKDEKKSSRSRSNTLILNALNQLSEQINQKQPIETRQLQEDLEQLKTEVSLIKAMLQKNHREGMVPIAWKEGKHVASTSLGTETLEKSTAGTQTDAPYPDTRQSVIINPHNVPQPPMGSAADNPFPLMLLPGDRHVQIEGVDYIIRYPSHGALRVPITELIQGLDQLKDIHHFSVNPPSEAVLTKTLVYMPSPPALQQSQSATPSKASAVAPAIPALQPANTLPENGAITASMYSNMLSTPSYSKF
ncbi:hypothetical protein PAHA111176_21515 [Parendozoicomonas haliclonae]|uniref:Uncharacterized protein n=2 Tax=Parendozoicomonas haliclonae TaxID=1960125 RepID=A0A1X7AQZ3_9GAMM|nr:hypothetical protein EHSB41UT_04330 [Parendozoicomonas haliclonae]